MNDVEMWSQFPNFQQNAEIQFLINYLKTSNDLDLKKVVAFSLKSNQCSMFENSLYYFFWKYTSYI